jgi:type II secretory pathway component PulF
LFSAKEDTFWNREIVIGGISSRERLVLVQYLHAGIKAGYSLIDTLRLALSQSRGKMKIILIDVISQVNRGAYLYESFGKYPDYFPAVFLNLIKSLMQLHLLLVKESELSQKIRSASIYPFFVLVAILGLGLSVSLFVLPNILPLFRSLNTELPVSTKILLWFSELFASYGVQIFWSVAFLVLLLAWVVHKDFSKPVTHWLMLRMPLFGTLYKKIVLARFSRTMCSLLRNGITIDQALENTAGSLTNIYYRNAILSVVPLISKGDTLSDSLEGYSFLFENMFLDMLALGEKTGSLEQTLSNINDYYESQVDSQTKNMITSLEPILLILVGLLVGFVAISILSPIYSISGSIQ